MIKTMKKPKWTKKMREQARIYGSQGGMVIVKKYGVKHMSKLSILSHVRRRKKEVENAA